MRHIVLLAVLTILLLPCLGLGMELPVRETRGLWVVRGENLLSIERIEQMIEDHLSLNMNTIFVQINGRAEAYYHSAITPMAPGVSPEFDPLQIILDRSHARGLEVHAWINAYTVAPLGKKPTNPEHVLNLHPDWLLVDAQGVSILDYSFDEASANSLAALMIEPGLPQVQDFVEAMFLEVVQNYDVDGVHFDYIRYPARNFGYHPVNVERFVAQHDIYPADLMNNADQLKADLGVEKYNDLSHAWDQLRRDNVTVLVRRIYRAIKATNPGVMVSAAVNPDLSRGYALEHRFQDWPAWLAEGILDAVVPMAYGNDLAIVVEQIKQAVDVVGNESLVFAGLGPYNVNDPKQMVAIIEQVRSVFPHGIVLFDHHSLQNDPDYMNYLRSEVFYQPSSAFSLDKN